MTKLFAAFDIISDCIFLEKLYKISVFLVDFQWNIRLKLAFLAEVFDKVIIMDNLELGNDFCLFESMLRLFLISKGLLLSSNLTSGTKKN